MTKVKSNNNLTDTCVNLVIFYFNWICDTNIQVSQNKSPVTETFLSNMTLCVFVI